MSVKDAGFVQKHIEKVVLGVGGLLFLLIAGYMFVGNPFAVGSGQHTFRNPQELENRIRQEADQLDANLRSSDRLEEALGGRTIPAYAQEFEQYMQRQLTESLALARVGVSMPGELEIPDPDPYFVPHPHAPSDLRVASGTMMLSNSDQMFLSSDQRRELTRLAGGSTNAPADFHYVSVATDWDSKDYYGRFSQAPPAGYAPLSDSWWQLRRGMGSVYLQRQAWDFETEQWGEPEYVDLLPGQIGTRPGDREWTRAEGREFMQEVLEYQGLVARPEFPPVGAGNIWFPPGEGPDLRNADPVELQEEFERRQRLLERMENDVRLLERLREQGGARDDINDAENRLDRVAQMTIPIEERIARLLGMERENLFGDEDIVANLTGEPSRSRQPQGQQQRQPQQRPQQQQQQQGMDEWDEWGVMPDEFGPGPGAPSRPGAGTRPGRNQIEQARAELEDDQRIWAHDLTVQPGGRYRYRVLPAVLNPLFDRRLHPDQAHYAAQIVIGPTSDQLADAPWSEPVDVKHLTYFFLVGGGDDAVDIELWRFYAGHWRSDTLALEAGQSIAGQTEIELHDGVEQQISLDSSAQLVDISNTDGELVISYELNGEAGQRTLSEDAEAVLRRELQVLSMLTQELARRLD